MKRTVLLGFILIASTLQAQRSSDVLSKATTANAVESSHLFATGDPRFKASAATSIRLLEVQFASEEESGESLRQEHYILDHKDELLNSYVDQKEAERRVSAMEARGVRTTVSDELRRGSLTIEEKHALYALVQKGGIKAVHKAVIASLKHKFLDSDSARPVSSTSDVYGGAHLVRVDCGLDTFDCRVIRIGAAACAFTGDPAGAFILAVWAASCC